MESSRGIRFQNLMAIAPPPFDILGFVSFMRSWDNDVSVTCEGVPLGPP